MNTILHFFFAIQCFSLNPLKDGFLRVTDWHNFGATSGIAWICMFAADKIVTGQTESDYLQFSVDMVINYGHLLASYQIF